MEIIRQNKIYKAKRESWIVSTLSKVAQTRKKHQLPPGELAQASYILLERDSTSEVGLDDVLLAQASPFSLE